MTANVEPLWTIEELGARAALALSVDYDGPANGQVRGVPDLRTIRYYTTLGLLDRPAAMRGRTALYGRRHLAQLVAVKRLQARGLSLAEVQRELLGLTDAALARLARLPADGDAKAAPAGRPAAGDRDAFWKEAPAPPPTAEAAAQTEHENHAGGPLVGVPLDGRATLLFAPLRPLEPDDWQAIRTVAGPLLKLLQKRRLLRPGAERNPR